MTDGTRGETNRLLGYPAEARLLIINADDFGMCHATNAAIIRTLPAGLVRSTTVMVPCPWGLHALQFLAAHQEIPFGVHLTVISEWPAYRWGPVTSRAQVPSLVNAAGYFYTFDQMPEFWRTCTWTNWSWSSGRRSAWCWRPGSNPPISIGIACGSAAAWIFSS